MQKYLVLFFSYVFSIFLFISQERDLGLRTSCTVENLRSPSVAGTNGRDEDDLNTDYAESDVMLGGGTGTNSNGSNNGNGSPEDRQPPPNSNMLASSRY